MGKTAVVFEHVFDDEFVDELNSVRAARIVLAERMLSDLGKTQLKLQESGSFSGDDTPSENEIAAQLRSNIDELRSRLAKVDRVVFADELTYYIDLIQRKSYLRQS